MSTLGRVKVLSADGRRCLEREENQKDHKSLVDESTDRINISV